MATVKKKMQAGGVSKKSPKAPMVDPKGAWTKVQERTLGNMKKGGKVDKAQLGKLFKRKPKMPSMEGFGDSPRSDSAIAQIKRSQVPSTHFAGSRGKVSSETGKPVSNKKGGTVKAKSGKQMMKRADGSYSQRGLWDNIRAAKGSGKKPTAAILKQERKMKAKKK